MKIIEKPLFGAVVGAAVILAALAARPRESAAGPTTLLAPDGGAPVERFDVLPFSDPPSPRPEPSEWQPVVPVTLSDALPPNCRAYRLHEWMKIRCSPLSTSSIALLGGAREGVFIFLDPPHFSGGVPDGGEVIFPVRRGDRRMFEWSTFGDSYDGPGSPEVAFMISESWPPGDARPTIIAH
ncbi:Hypothetical protein A7982_00951 [Minicystis rosea]|nr:Hypothetical protein A7982_00951 [Minicystis rosea]